MLTKEKLGNLLSKLARVFPGIPSYQDRESLRDQDKAVRTVLADRLVDASAEVSGAVNVLMENRGLAQLGKVDRVRRKLLKLADDLKFSPYGYTGVFSGNQVDEERLARVYEFDLEMAAAVAGVEAAVKRFRDNAGEGSPDEAVKGLEESLRKVADGLKEREALLKGV